MPRLALAPHGSLLATAAQRSEGASLASAGGEHRSGCSAPGAGRAALIVPRARTRRGAHGSWPDLVGLFDIDR